MDDVTFSHSRPNIDLFVTEKNREKCNYNIFSKSRPDLVVFTVQTVWLNRTPQILWLLHSEKHFFVFFSAHVSYILVHRYNYRKASINNEKQKRNETIAGASFVSNSSNLTFESLALLRLATR